MVELTIVWAASGVWGPASGRVCPVSVGPGTTTTARTPSGADSAAIPSVNDVAHPFVAP